MTELGRVLLFVVAVAGRAAGECGEHPAPAHGKLVDSVWVPGAISIRCDYGYVPVGWLAEAMLRCAAVVHCAGRWDRAWRSAPRTPGVLCWSATLP